MPLGAYVLGILLCCAYDCKEKWEILAREERPPASGLLTDAFPRLPLAFLGLALFRSGG
jgi:hypothetical protein